MTTIARRLPFGLLLLTLLTASLPAAPVTLENCLVSSFMSNGPARQYVEGSFRASVLLQPGGQTATVNCKITTRANERTPLPTIFGTYRGIVELTIRVDGESVTITRNVPIQVKRQSMTIQGLGTASLARPLNPTKSGRQNFRATGLITIRGL
jgi:hypothetical protein